MTLFLWVCGETVGSGPATGLANQEAVGPVIGPSTEQVSGGAHARRQALPGVGTFCPHPLTTVVQLGMSLTEFFTSSSVTSKGSGHISLVTKAALPERGDHSGQLQVTRSLSPHWGPGAWS